MATLVLTAVGTAIGGPIGGAIGALVGQQIDQNILFKPKGREGPRLQELAVQTSSYGSQVPRIFGKMRVAGTVIWATDLKESKNTEGGGKGRPKTTTYSYSACFAVALSSREIRDIGRVWADGKIFRGSAGDFKTPTGFRFYDGVEDQSIDTLIGSVEGTDETPSYRGLALAVFDDMDLADYGNRIPSLTFEIIADDGAVSLAEIVDDVSGKRIALNSDEELHGYSASGQSRRDALAAINENYLLAFSTQTEPIIASSREKSQPIFADINADEAVTNLNGSVIEKPEYQTLPETKIPRQLALRYYEPARDYQSGLQNAFRPGNGRVITNHDFPAALSATQAKKLGQTNLWTAYQERISSQLHVLRSSQLFWPGSTLQFIKDGRQWRVRGWELKDGVIALSLTKAGNQAGFVDPEAEEGRAISDVDVIAGETKLVLADLPFSLESPDQASDVPQLYAAAAGNIGWRNADLFQSLVDGSTGALIARIPVPATIGETDHQLNSASALVFDHQNMLDISLHNASMTLSSADEIQLSAGKNLALIGFELVQFGTAVPLGNNRYRLSDFSRGLGGTEKYIDGHQANENFLLIEPALMTRVEPQYISTFQTNSFLALGRGDDEPVSETVEAPGIALRPWSPVHLSSRFNAAGDLELSWIRRSRAGFTWPDYVDVPLAEETEKYLMSVGDGSDGFLDVSEVTSPSAIILLSKIEEYRAQNISSLIVSVQQIGTFALSDVIQLQMEI